MSRRKIILDTDLNFPSDDFQALQLLLMSPAIDLLGVCAAAGNTWMEEVFFNIKHALKLCAREDVPVLQGEAFGKWSGELEWARLLKANGTKKFVGAFEKGSRPRLSETQRGLIAGRRADAPEFICEQVLNRADECEIVSIGPLTNISKAIARDGQIAAKIKTIHIMGGRILGPEDPYREADFNFWFDPEAARTVFASGAKIILFPREVCVSARTGPSLTSAVCAPTHPGWALFADDFLGMIDQHGAEMPLWDQLVALAVIDPDIVAHSVQGSVTVEVNNTDARGHCSFTPTAGGNVQLVQRINPERLRATLLALLAARRNGSSGVVNANSVVAPSTGKRQQTFFGTPRFRYYAEERLRRKPLLFLGASYGDGGYTDESPFEVTDPEALTEILSSLARLLLSAKERGELWPPAPLADAVIAADRDRGSKGEPYSFGYECLKEMEMIFFRRFMLVDAVCFVHVDGKKMGFTCISPLTEVRRQQFIDDFGVPVPSGACVTEFGIVDGHFRGKKAFEYMNNRLIGHRQITSSEQENPTVYGVVLDSQIGCQNVIQEIGYRKAAERIIPDGPEAGRLLHLYSRPLFM